jgi:hypothetical protein
LVLLLCPSPAVYEPVVAAGRHQQPHHVGCGAGVERRPQRPFAGENLDPQARTCQPLVLPELELLITSDDASPAAVTLPCATRTSHGIYEGSWSVVRVSSVWAENGRSARPAGPKWSPPGHRTVPPELPCPPGTATSRLSAIAARRLCDCPGKQAHGSTGSAQASACLSPTAYPCRSARACQAHGSPVTTRDGRRWGRSLPPGKEWEPVVIARDRRYSREPVAGTVLQVGGAGPGDRGQAAGAAGRPLADCRR